jgi:hypothetical protein
VPCHGTDGASAGGASPVLPSHGNRPKENDPPGTWHATIPERRQHLRRLKREQRTQGVGGRSHCISVRPGIREHEEHPIDPSVAHFQRHATRECLRVMKARLELRCCDRLAIEECLVPGPLIGSLSDRYFHSHAKSRAQVRPEGRNEPNVRVVSERTSAWKGSNRQVEPDDRAEPGRDQDVQPRREPTFDTTQLGSRDACGGRDGFQRQSGCQTSSSDLLAELGEESTTSAASAGGVRLRHRRIVTAAAYRPINGAATIAE